MDAANLLRTYLERVVVGGEVELIDDLAQEDMVDEANRFFGGPPGRAGLVAHVKGFERCIDDVEVTIDRVVGSDESAMAWWSFRGIHNGPWLGIPPTHDRVEATVFSLFDVTDGKVSRYRVWLHATFPASVVFDSSRPERPSLPGN